jgi:bacteriorhodopsin
MGMESPESLYLPEGTEVVGDAGKIGLWIAFVCMALPCLYFYYKAQTKKVGERQFEYLSMTINGIASLAYLTMASGYGASAVNGQQFFYARYVDWTLTTPLMLVDLAYLANAKCPLETVLHLVAIDVLMIVGGLVGALQGGQTSSWMFFAYSMFFFTLIFYTLLVDQSFVKDQKYGEVYNQAVYLTAIFWCGYPIAWVLHEGLSIISLDTAVIIYLILDTICKSVWGFLITMGRDNADTADHASIKDAEVGMVQQ